MVLSEENRIETEDTAVAAKVVSLWVEKCGDRTPLSTASRRCGASKARVARKELTEQAETTSDDVSEAIGKDVV